MKIKESLKKYPLSMRVSAGLLMLLWLYVLVKLLTVLFSNPVVIDDVSGVLQEVKCTPTWSDNGKILHSDTAIIRVGHPESQTVQIIEVPIRRMYNYGVDIAKEKMKKTPSEKYVAGDVILLERHVYAYRLENTTDYKLSSCELKDGELCELDNDYGWFGIISYLGGLIFTSLLLWKIIRSRNTSEDEKQGC